jgi:toxin ParE1/3/4
MKVRWVRTALADIEAIEDHIARDDPRRAFEIVWAIKTRVETLADFPDIGRNGRVIGTRELVLADLPWIVVYRPRPPHIEILRIIHGHQRWPSLA